MKLPDGRKFTLALGAWIDADESGRTADLIAEFVCERALSGHFGYFKLLINLVDGKLHPTAEEELTFEAHCVPLVVDERATDVLE